MGPIGRGPTSLIPSVAVRAGILLASAFFGLWLLLDALLASDRGLDLTDEGLYLLAADPPSRIAAWGTPWGWHTAPLFRLVSGDLASFRTLGAVLLVVASALLAITVASGRWRMPGHRADPASPVELTLAGVVGALGGYLYYAGMLRTPSYNWVVVVGSVIAVTGMLLNLPPAHHRLRLPGDAVAAFGLFVTIPSKPTSPILLAAALGVLVWRRAGIRPALVHVLRLAGATTFLLVLAVLLRVWPLRFLDPFLAALSMPTPTDGQTIWGAVLGYVRLPDTVLRMAPAVLLAVGAVLLAQRLTTSVRSERSRLILGSGTVVAVGLLWLGLRILSTAVYEERAAFLNRIIAGRGTFPLDYYLGRAFDIWIAVAGVVLIWATALVAGLRRMRWATFAALLGVAAFEAGIGQSVLVGGEGRLRFVQHGTTTAMVLLVALGLVALVDVDEDAPYPTVPRRPPSGVLGVVGFLLAAAFSTAFGSAHGPYRQTSLAAAILVAAALVPTMSISRRERRLFPLVLLASGLLALSASFTADNWAHPYRTSPIGENVIPTTMGSANSAILLDPETAGILHALRVAADESGWRTGEPLLSVVDPWNSTLPWVLGSRVPDSLMLTLGGRRELLDWNLARLDHAAFGGAWLLVSNPDAQATQRRDRGDDRDSPATAIEKVATTLGAVFPDDYVLVYSAPPMVRDPNLAVQLWRPR